MKRIFLYSLFDNLRSKWSIIYMMFFFLFTSGLLILGGELSRTVAGLLNVVIILCPLIAAIFGIIYLYVSRDLIELLLARPIRRSRIILGLYFGLSVSLSFNFLFGVGIPFLIFGYSDGMGVGQVLSLLMAGTLLTFIFSAISFYIGLAQDDRIKGLSLSIFIWLFWAIVYDGLFMMGLLYFQDYPLENVALACSILNPIDLSRILVLLELDISALMGYTGAVFRNFFGSHMGVLVSLASLLAWIVLPILMFVRKTLKKDF